jgi:hypothetical protein
MKPESTEQKYERIRLEIQNLVLSAYPNPDRQGCPGSSVVAYLARRVANWEDIEEEADYQHIMHCSPCYAEYLDAREELRASSDRGEPPKRMPRHVEKKIGRTLEQLEKLMKSCSRAN